MVHAPEKADIFSLSEYISVAFYSVHRISPLNWDYDVPLAWRTDRPVSHHLMHT